MTTNGKPTTEEGFKFPEMAGLYGPAFGHGPWFYTCHRYLDDCLARLGLKLAQQRVATWMLWLSRERVDGQTVYGSSVSIGYKALARGISVSTAQSAVHALVEKGLTPILENGVGATEGRSGSATTYDLQPLRAALAKALAQLQDEQHRAKQRRSRRTEQSTVTREDASSQREQKQAPEEAPVAGDDIGVDPRQSIVDELRKLIANQPDSSLAEVFNRALEEDAPLGTWKSLLADASRVSTSTTPL